VAATGDVHPGWGHPLGRLARAVLLDLVMAELVHRLRRPAAPVSDDGAPRKHHPLRALGRALLVEALESFVASLRWQEKRAAAAVEHAAAVQSVKARPGLGHAIPRQRAAHESRDAVSGARPPG
jgi:hypothetical protein